MPEPGLHGPRRASLLSAFLVLALVPAIPSPAESPAPPALARPDSLPASEAFTYERTIAGVKDLLKVELARKEEKGRTWYELRSQAPDESADFVLDPLELAVLRSDVTTDDKAAKMRRVTEILEERYRPAPDELVIGATAPFQQRLRLLPFAKGLTYKVLFQGSAAATAFTLQLTVAARETVQAGGRSWDCWRLELGASGGLGLLMGSLIGKTRYWYAAEWPHVLVRTEGSSGGPGSPQLVMELVSYSAGARTAR